MLCAAASNLFSESCSCFSALFSPPHVLRIPLVSTMVSSHYPLKNSKLANLVSRSAAFVHRCPHWRRDDLGRLRRESCFPLSSALKASRLRRSDQCGDKKISIHLSLSTWVPSVGSEAQRLATATKEDATCHAATSRDTLRTSECRCRSSVKQGSHSLKTVFSSFHDSEACRNSPDAAPPAPHVFTLSVL